jgi:YD repeat-containing protein
VIGTLTADVVVAVPIRPDVLDHVTYTAVGALGALQPATIDGPFTNDTMSYAYDELGRVTQRLLAGTGVTLSYDALGRVVTLAHAVGTFSYGYVGQTGRLQSVAYPNGQTSTYQLDG